MPTMFNDVRLTKTFRKRWRNTDNVETSILTITLAATTTSEKPNEWYDRINRNHTCEIEMIGTRVIYNKINFVSGNINLIQRKRNNYMYCTRDVRTRNKSKLRFERSRYSYRDRHKWAVRFERSRDSYRDGHKFAGQLQITLSHETSSSYWQFCHYYLWAFPVCYRAHKS